MARPSANYTEEERKKDKKFVFILYPDATNYDCEILLNKVSGGYWQKYYYILHNRDTYSLEEYDEYLVTHPGIECPFNPGDLKKPHYHVVVTCDACMLGLAKKKAGLESGVFPCKNVKAAVQYLIHLNNPSKFQYQPEEIITNDETIGKLLTKTEDTEDKAAKILDAIYSDNVFSMTSLSRWAIQNHCWDELRRGQHIYHQILSEKLYLKSKEEKLNEIQSGWDPGHPFHERQNR